MLDYLYPASELSFKPHKLKMHTITVVVTNLFSRKMHKPFDECILPWIEMHIDAGFMCLCLFFQR